MGEKKEYIERGALKQKKVYSVERHECVVPVAEIDWMPAADVVEVVHGEWDIKSRSWRMIDDDYDEEIYVECPFCKRTFYVPYELDDEKALAYARENYPYCHCGAKMDGERKEQT